MKKALIDILGIVSILCIFFGMPLFIVNVAKEDWRKWIFLGMAIGGFLVLCLLAFLRYKQKKK